MITQTQHEQLTGAAGTAPFNSPSASEKLTGHITRMMLYYHIARVQLGCARPGLTEQQRTTIRRYAIEVRRGGFRLARDAQESRIVIGDYDDEMLRREGTRIAYLIARGDIESAMRHEEAVIAGAVREALTLTITEGQGMAIAA